MKKLCRKAIYLILFFVFSLTTFFHLLSLNIIVERQFPIKEFDDSNAEFYTMYQWRNLSQNEKPIADATEIDEEIDWLPIKVFTENAVQIRLPERIKDQPKEPDIFFGAEIAQMLEQRLKDRPGDCRHFRKLIKKEQLAFKGAWEVEWGKCGRKTNALVRLQDGTIICLRNRRQNESFSDEILSLELAHTMGVKSVPCTTLLPIDQFDLKKIGWKTHKNTLLLAIEWIADLERRQSLPTVLLDMMKKSKDAPLRPQKLGNFSKEEKLEIAQWTDMFVFDYLTEHYDRLASLQDVAEEQTSLSVLNGPIRNCAFDTNNILWLLDNKAALLDGYHLRHAKTPTNHSRFHKNTIQPLCVFRKSTVQNLCRLITENDPLDQLLEKVHRNEPLFKILEVENGRKFAHVKSNFKQRLTKLVGHWKWCSQVNSIKRNSLR